MLSQDETDRYVRNGRRSESLRSCDRASKYILDFPCPPQVYAMEAIWWLRNAVSEEANTTTLTQLVSSLGQCYNDDA
jgi:hypothetical protein